jgi:hypothetical protein
MGILKLSHGFASRRGHLKAVCGLLVLYRFKQIFRTVFIFDANVLANEIEDAVSLPLLPHPL